MNSEFFDTESLPANEGIWGTGVFTAYELKTLTRPSILTVVNGQLQIPSNLIKVEPSNFYGDDDSPNGRDAPSISVQGQSSAQMHQQTSGGGSKGRGSSSSTRTAGLVSRSASHQESEVGYKN